MIMTANEREPLLADQDRILSPSSSFIEQAPDPETADLDALLEEDPTHPKHRPISPVPSSIIILYLLFIVPVTFCASTISLDVDQDVVYQVICRQFDVPSEKCLRDTRAGRAVTDFFTVQSVICGLINLVTITYFVSLSDVVGRKPVLIYSMVTGALSALALWYIGFYWKTLPSYWLLLIPGIIDSLGGELSLVLKMSTVFTADIFTCAPQRAFWMSINDGLALLSETFGPAWGNWIGDRTDGEKVLVSVTIILVILPIIAIVAVTETLPRNHRRHHRTPKIEMLWFKGVKNPDYRWNARLLLLNVFFGTECRTAFVSILLMYPKRTFGWGGRQGARLAMYLSGTRTFWELIGFPYVYTYLGHIWQLHSHRVDHIDVTLLAVSSLFAASGYLTMGVSTSSSGYYMGAVIDACSAIGGPIYKSAVLKHVPKSSVGSFVSSLSLLEQVGRIVAQAGFLRIYSLTYDWCPNFAFLCIGSAFIALFGTSFVYRPEVVV